MLYLLSELRDLLLRDALRVPTQRTHQNGRVIILATRATRHFGNFPAPKLTVAFWTYLEVLEVDIVLLCGKEVGTLQLERLQVQPWHLGCFYQLFL